MVYSGAKVLAHLSELARQRARLPRISSILIMSQERAGGELIRSTLRAVVGYDTSISVVLTHAEASQHVKLRPPQIAFHLGGTLIDRPSSIASHFQALRKAGIICPVAIIRNVMTPKIKCQILDLGAIDVFHRDEICGLRLRECLLKLAPV